MYLVYLATSPSNKVYVGITSKSLKIRKSQHISRAKRQNRNNPFLGALIKYNFNFKWEILEENLSQKEAEDLEKFYIAKFNSTNRELGYNLSAGGLSGNIRSEEGEAKRKAKMALYYKDPEFKKQLSAAQKKRFEAQDPWNKGKNTSQETIVKLINAHLGNKSRLGHFLRFCKYGHDTFVTGRDKFSRCKQCRRKI